MLFGVNCYLHYWNHALGWCATAWPQAKEDAANSKAAANASKVQVFSEAPVGGAGASGSAGKVQAVSEVPVDGAGASSTGADGVAAGAEVPAAAWGTEGK